MLHLIKFVPYICRGHHVGLFSILQMGYPGFIEWYVLTHPCLKLSNY